MSSPPCPRRYVLVAACLSSSAVLLVSASNVGASGISMADAVFVTQSWSADADVFETTLPRGLTTTYTFNDTNTAAAWTGSLTGGTLSVNYVGDASKFARSGLITWTASGNVGASPFTESGTALFTPTTQGDIFAFTSVADAGGTTWTQTITGPVYYDSNGVLTIPDSSTAGSIYVNDAYLAAIDYGQSGGVTVYTRDGGFAFWDTPRVTSAGGVVGTIYVPEPSTLNLLGIGTVVGLLGYALRRRKQVA